MNIVAVCANYRKGGVTERVMAAAVEGARTAGARVDTLTLRDINFEFCRNCQACWDAAGRDQPEGDCPIRDDLTAWIARIGGADGIILAAPINFSALTALFKKFQERCLPLTRLKPLPRILQWLTGMPALPVARHAGRPRPMICITASGAPAGMGRLLYPCAVKQFQAFASAWSGRLSRLIWASGYMLGVSPRLDRVLDEARAAGGRMAAGR